MVIGERGGGHGALDFINGLEVKIDFVTVCGGLIEDHFFTSFFGGG